MLLITGEIASGKSRALHELEARPPLGWRPIYVPVPTLDLAGLVCWCLDRVGLPPGDDPVETLRSASATRAFLLLIDDAERLPVQTALGVRKLERDAGAQHLVVVVACDTENAQSPPLVALGTPQETAKLGPGVDPGAAAARVRALLEPTPPAPKPRTGEPPNTRVRAAALAAAEASARAALPHPPPQRVVYPSAPAGDAFSADDAAPHALAAREAEPRPAALPSAAARGRAAPAWGRSAPLWTVALIGIVQPAVFAVGFLLGRQSASPPPPAPPAHAAPAVAEAEPVELPAHTAPISTAPTEAEPVPVVSDAARDVVPEPSPKPARPAPVRVPSRAEADPLGAPTMVRVGPASDSPN